MILTLTISSLKQKYDAKPTYKKFLGYSPGVAVINDMIVGIENRDGNTNVRFNQKTLERIFKRLEASEIYISRARMDCGSCSEEIVDMVEAHCRHFIFVPTDALLSTIPCLP